MPRLVSSKRISIRDLEIGDKFRFVDGKYFYTVIDKKGPIIYCRHRLIDTTYSFRINKIVLKSKEEFQLPKKNK